MTGLQIMSAIEVGIFPSVIEACDIEIIVIITGPWHDVQDAVRIIDETIACVLHLIKAGPAVAPHMRDDIGADRCLPGKAIGAQRSPEACLIAFAIDIFDQLVHIAAHDF